MEAANCVKLSDMLVVRAAATLTAVVLATTSNQPLQSQEAAAAHTCCGEVLPGGETAGPRTERERQEGVITMV